MATLNDFIPRTEDPRIRLINEAKAAGMKSVARDLEDELRMSETRTLPMYPTFRAGQFVWWFPPAGERPAFMSRTERMLAATVKSVNQEQRTVLIEHEDVTHKKHTFLVSIVDVIKREIPR